ncbi:hypothetical protein DAI22_11g240050 [Oryza sativa Japonica Group]|nr:hypothetical protein DAI22_11g240050 [Oryza sativa Japonica Group]
MLKLSRTLELLGPEETSETILAFSNFSKDGCHNKDIFCDNSRCVMMETTTS